jgi:hypothetical protein
MLTFAEAGKHLINIHDGNLCRTSDAPLLNELMRTYYFDAFKNRPEVKTE